MSLHLYNELSFLEDIWSSLWNLSFHWVCRVIYRCPQSDGWRVLTPSWLPSSLGKYSQWSCNPVSKCFFIWCEILSVNSSTEFITGPLRPQKRVFSIRLKADGLCGVDDLPPRVQVLVWDPRGHRAATASQVLTACHVCTVPIAASAQTHRSVTIVLGGKYCHCTHSAGEPEAPRDRVICPSSHSAWVLETCFGGSWRCPQSSCGLLGQCSEGWFQVQGFGGAKLPALSICWELGHPGLGTVLNSWVGPLDPGPG